jgi:hypothetical protein
VQTVKLVHKVKLVQLVKLVLKVKLVHKVTLVLMDSSAVSPLTIHLAQTPLYQILAQEP